MINYKPGYFVKLKDDIFRLDWKMFDNYDSPNIFMITEMQKDKEDKIFYLLSGVKKPISIDDIEPIPVNEKDDRWIYYSPLPCLPNVDLRSNPNLDRDSEQLDLSSYYLPRIKFGDDNKLSNKQFLKKHNLKYVHEVQEYLYKMLNRQPLEINKYKIT